MSGNQRGPENGDTALAGLFAIDPAAIKIGKEIGKGAFSVVYAGEYNKKHVAVKCQPKDEHGQIPQFVLKEVQILQKLRHPNILEFIGAADNRKTRQILILSEHSNNGDLDQLRKNMRQGKTTHVGWLKVIQIATDIAQGLAFLHGAGMVHRDIKSSNILLDENLRAKLCDFGFATETKWWYEQQGECDEPEKAGTAPRRKSYCGTDAYMAPEMFLDEDYNENVDVFSFGVVLMELLCCRQANKDGFLMRLPQHKFQILDDEFHEALPVSCPVRIAELAKKCVSFEPRERPTIAEVVTQLQQILSLKDLVESSGPVELRPFTPMQQAVVECEPQLEDDDGDDDEEEADEDEDYRDDDSAADTMEMDEEEEVQEMTPVLPPPFHTGSLLKRNRRGNRGWAEKVFILDRDQLHYTDAPPKNQQQPQNKTTLGRRPSQPTPVTTSSLCLKDCRIWKTMEMPELCFNILNGNWKIVRELRALTHDDLDKWMELLNQAIDFATEQHQPPQKAATRAKHKEKIHNNSGRSNSTSGSYERRCSRGSRGKTKHVEERRPESAGKKAAYEMEDTYEDQDDEVYQWLKQLGLERHTATFKAKGFSTVDFVRETGIESDDLNFLGIKDTAARKTLMQAARTLRGED